jgi:Ca2+-binding RTX toxin-like protein
VPAVVATLRNFELVVNIDNNSRSAQNVQIWSDMGLLSVIATGAGGSRTVAYGKPVASSSVRRITVNGSDLDNRIDLGQVTTAGFRGLNHKVTVNAGGGNDWVLGSEFADRLNGNGGNDTIGGGSGGDEIIDGGTGDDFLDGGNGDDTLIGGPGGDWSYGGPGHDTVTDYEVNIDHVYVDIESVNRKR